MIHAVRAIGLLFFALAAGCSGVGEPPPNTITQSEPLLVDQSPAAPIEAAVVAAALPLSETQEAAAVAPVPLPEMPRQPVKAAAKVPAVPVSSAQSRKNEASPPAAKMPEPPLDVAALKARLRDTSALGVFTKLALKNQVDDLLKQFRAHYQGERKSSVASLRQPYDMLVLKVLALVQDTDPALARTISASREAIWGILADREKFNLMT